MAISKVVYDGTTLVDLTNDTVTSETMFDGVSAHNAAGESIVGTVDLSEYLKKSDFVDITQAEYDALDPPDPNVTYFVLEETT